MKKIIFAFVMTGFFVSAHSTETLSGKEIYNNHCVSCHNSGPGNVGTTVLSNRYSSDEAVLLNRKNLHPEFIRSIVRHGLGIMPGFRPTEINDSDLEKLSEFLSIEGEK